MRLKIIEKSVWTYCTPCEENGDSELYDFFASVGARYAKDLAGLWSKLETISKNPLGPKSLHSSVCHYVDQNEGIYQITHGSLRLLFFHSKKERRFVICPVAFKKKGQKTPISYVNAAIKVKNLYLAAYKAGKVQILPEEEDE